MTRTEQTEKLLNRIRGIAVSIDNEMIKGMIDTYFNNMASFRNRNIDIVTMKDGACALHQYIDGPTIRPTEFHIFSHTSAKEVIDMLHNILDRMELLNMQKIILGIRTKNINDVSFQYLNYYYGTYSITGFDGTDYWTVNNANGMPTRLSIEKSNKDSSSLNYEHLACIDMSVLHMQGRNRSVDHHSV